MDTFEIQDDDIDVREIMRQISEIIKKKKENGAYPADGWMQNNPAIANKYYTESDLFLGEYNILSDLENVKIFSDIKNNSYRIVSHRPILGIILRKGRELVHGEVRRYIDPIIGKQMEFNRSTARILISFQARMDQITEENNKNIKTKNVPLQAVIDGGLRRISEHEIHPENESDRNFGSEGGNFDSSLSKYTVLEGRDAQSNSPRFDGRFRGHSPNIKQMQAKFVHCFDQCNNVLDIGCGSGEILELLGDMGIGAHGVDLDADAVAYCKSRGLRVEQIDAISYLGEIEDDSLDGVFIDKIAEHMMPNYLVEALALCYRKIKPNYYIVIKNMNFISLSKNIQLDIVHGYKNRIHHETMEFLLESCGFKVTETTFLSQDSDMLRKRTVVDDNGIKAFIKRACNAIKGRDACQKVIYNNSYKFNKTINISRDYLVIGRKLNESYA